MKNGYKAPIHSKKRDKVDIPLKLYWNSTYLPNVGLFLWLNFQNRILTIDKLFKLGFHSPSRCVLCNQNCEDSNNLLFNCPFSQICWEWIRHMLGWSMTLPKSFIKLLKG